jgi:hypothetical protein
MAETGESYQQALSRLSSAYPSLAWQPNDVDLLSIDYFGTKVTLATFELMGNVSCVVLASSCRVPFPSPKSPFLALERRRTVH